MSKDYYKENVQKKLNHKNKENENTQKKRVDSVKCYLNDVLTYNN